MKSDFEKIISHLFSYFLKSMNDVLGIRHYPLFSRVKLRQAREPADVKKNT